MFRTTRQKIDDFRKGRERQTDADFIRECHLPSAPHAESVALAVRRAAASIGLIDPLYIRAGDRCPGELEMLPLWDSMDWVMFILEIEEELGVDIPDSEAERITTRRDFSIRHCVHDVLGVVQQLQVG